jgi:hypothetical protein
MSGFDLTSPSDRARRAAGVVGLYWDFDPRDLYRGTRGTPEESFARQVAMYLCHAAYKIMPTEISLGFRRDRSTVEHAIKSVALLCEQDYVFEEHVAHLVDVLVEADKRCSALKRELMSARAEYGAPARKGRP